MAYLLRTVDRGLIDLAWLDHGPALRPLRNDPRFVDARGTVAERVRPILAALSTPLA